MSRFAGHPEPYPEVVTWRAIGVRAIDGDTITVQCDQGFDGTTRDIDIRVAGIDTWEVVGEHKAKGLAAKAFTGWHIEGAWLRVTTRKFKRSFTRYEGTVEIWASGQWWNLADMLRAEGHEKVAG